MKNTLVSFFLLLSLLPSEAWAQACIGADQNSRVLLEYLVDNPNLLEVRGRPEAMTIQRKRHIFRRRLNGNWFAFVYPHQAPRQNLVLEDRPLRVKRIRNYHERGYSRAGSNDFQIKFEDRDISVLLLHMPGQLTVSEFLQGLRSAELPLELRLSGVAVRSKREDCLR